MNEMNVWTRLHTRKGSVCSVVVASSRPIALQCAMEVVKLEPLSLEGEEHVEYPE